MADRDGQAAKEAAVEWFVRLRDESVSQADANAFREWLAADPAHAAAYRDLDRLWNNLDDVALRPGRFSASHSDLRRGTDRSSRGLKGAFARLRRRGRERDQRTAFRPLVLVASFASAVAVGLYAFHFFEPPADYDTRTGEQQSVELLDGSRLYLNTASAASIEFTEARRTVLLHAGEIYVEVASDADRPFVVDAGTGTATALGTSFSVKRRHETFDVLVTSSRVDVVGSDVGSMIVEAGQGVRVTATGIQPVEQRSVQTALSWRSGRLVFDGLPLGEVLAELDRYLPGRVVIADSAVKAIPVTATFSIARIDTALETIEQTLPVRLIRLGDRLTFVFAAAPL